MVADAALKIDTAEMHFNRVAVADTGYANQMCKEALDISMLASGSGFVYDGHQLQRIFRDFWTLYSHRSLSPTITKEN